VPPRHRKHFTHKPIPLLRELLQAVRGIGAVIDPFAGSGSTLAAALLELRPAIGVECEKDMCEVARRECAQLGHEVGIAEFKECALSSSRERGRAEIIAETTQRRLTST